GNSLPEGSPAVCSVVAPQLSVPTGASKVTTAVSEPESVDWLIFSIQAITGASLSITVTVNVIVEVFPEASVAVYSTIVVPTGNSLPGSKPSVKVTTVPSQLSVAVGTSKFTVAPQIPASTFTVISLTGSKTGAS